MVPLATRSINWVRVASLTAAIFSTLTFESCALKAGDPPTEGQLEIDDPLEDYGDGNTGRIESDLVRTDNVYPFAETDAGFQRVETSVTIVASHISVSTSEGATITLVDEESQVWKLSILVTDADGKDVTPIFDLAETGPTTLTMSWGHFYGGELAGRLSNKIGTVFAFHYGGFIVPSKTSIKGLKVEHGPTVGKWAAPSGSGEIAGLRFIADSETIVLPGTNGNIEVDGQLFGVRTVANRKYIEYKASETGDSAAWIAWKK